MPPSSAVMDAVFSNSAPSSTPLAHSKTGYSPPPSHHASSGAGAWTLPSILKQGGRGGLSNISVEELNQCLQPVLAGLQQLDPESLLQLERVQSGGARLRDGYVPQLFVVCLPGWGVSAEQNSSLVACIRKHPNQKLTFVRTAFRRFSLFLPTSPLQTTASKSDPFMNK